MVLRLVFLLVSEIVNQMVVGILSLRSLQFGVLCGKRSVLLLVCLACLGVLAEAHMLLVLVVVLQSVVRISFSGMRLLGFLLFGICSRFFSLESV